MKTLRLIVLCAALLFSGCSQTPVEEIIAYTYSSGPELDAGTIAELTTASEIQHTFSDGNGLHVFIVGQHAFTDGADVAIAPQAKLPEFIENYEVSLTQLSTQGIGFVPGSTDADGTANLWPSAKNSSVIYYTIGTFPSTLRPYVEQAINEWNATSVAIKWKPKPATTNYKTASLIWTSGSGTLAEPIFKLLGCSTVPAYTAGIGYQDDGLGFPVGNTVYMNSKCQSRYELKPTLFKRTLQHEMGHVVGLWHEQQRCDRENYLSFSVTPTPSALNLPYYFNFGKRCETNIKQYGPYDFKAIMHYGLTAGGSSYDTSGVKVIMNARSTLPYLSYCGTPGDVEKGNTLSAGDVYAINTMYGKTASTSLCGVNAYPTRATVKSGTSLSIAAAASGYNLSSTDKSLKWSISPSTGSGSLSATASGFSYLAPRVTSTKTVTLTATSTKDSTKKVSVVLTVTP